MPSSSGKASMRTRREVVRVGVLEYSCSYSTSSSSSSSSSSRTVVKAEKLEEHETKQNESEMDVVNLEGNLPVLENEGYASTAVAEEEEDKKEETNGGEGVVDAQEVAFVRRPQEAPEDEVIASPLSPMDRAPSVSDNVYARGGIDSGFAGAQILDDVRIIVAGIAATAVLSFSFVVLSPRPNQSVLDMQQPTAMQSMDAAIPDDNDDADELLLVPGIQMMMKATQPPDVAQNIGSTSSSSVSSSSNALDDVMNGRGGALRDVIMISLVIAALASAFGNLKPSGQDEDTRRGTGRTGKGGQEKEEAEFDVEAKRRELLRTLELDIPSPPSSPPSSSQDARRSSSSADASSSGRAILSGSACMPHPLKRDSGGEDANFILLSEQPKSDDAERKRGRVLGVIGVADGVSAWAEEGVDAGTYSRKLMANTRLAAVSMMKKDPILQFGGAESDAAPSRKPLPLQSLIQAQDTTREEGSCCALVYAVSSCAGDKTMRMDVTSVGDCGLRVIRGGNVVYASKVQEHAFNRPYQLGSEQLFPGCDIASKSAVTEGIPLQVGDAIVAGSDGLFDNMFDTDIVAVMSEFTARSTYTKETAKQAAALIADIATRNSIDSSYRSPFAVEVASKLPNGGLPLWRRALGQQYAGGKADDITVVVTFVI